MAVDVYSSPRISFSHDLTDPSSDSLDPTRSDQLLLSPTFDFDFRTSNLTPADELFSNGKILPTQIKNPQITQNIQNTQNTLTKLDNPNSNPPKKRLKELIEDQDNDKSTFKSSFWQFRRSASLNCDNGKGTKGLLRSLSIKSLARSNSTGSALNPKRNSGQKVVDKSKESMFLRRCSSLNQPVPVYYSYRNNPNKDSRTGIRIIPVLNIPPVNNFFGFASLFCNGKVKKKTKS